MPLFVYSHQPGSNTWFGCRRLKFTILNKNHKKNGGYIFLMPPLSPQKTICACTPASVFQFSGALAKRRASLWSMNAATLLSIKAKLGMRHEEVLTTEQFELLTARTNNGAVTEQQLLGLLNQAWALRCDGTLDEGKYAEDIRAVINEMPPPSRSSSTAAISALALQAHSVPPAAPAAACSVESRSKEKQCACEGCKGLVKHRERLHPGPQGDKPMSTYSSISRCDASTALFPLASCRRLHSKMHTVHMCRMFVPDKKKSRAKQK